MSKSHAASERPVVVSPDLSICIVRLCTSTYFRTAKVAQVFLPSVSKGRFKLKILIPTYFCF